MFEGKRSHSNHFPGFPISSHGESAPHPESSFESVHPEPVKNGFQLPHSTSPVKGFFGEQGGDDATQNTLISTVQIQHNAETSSSKLLISAAIF